MSAYSKPESINEWISEYMRRTTDNSISGVVNGSVTPVTMRWTAARPAQIHDMVVSIVDNGNFTSSGYGAIASIPNGLQFEHRRGATTRDLFDSAGLFSNAGWAELAFEFRVTTFSGGGNRILVARWEFDRSSIPLHLNAGDTLNMVLRDDFTTLVRHRFLLHGRYVGA